MKWKTRLSVDIQLFGPGIYASSMLHVHIMQQTVESFYI